MQQFVLKRKLSVLFDAVKSKNVHYLEEKIQPIEKIVTKKSEGKKCLNFEI